MHYSERALGMLRSTVAKYIRLTWEIKKLVFASAMSYRTSFLVQVLGMFFNDGAIMMFWYIFFKSFPVVNGWSYHDMMVLFAFSTFVYAFCNLPFEGITDLAKYIISGKLDLYLTGPKNVLWAVAISKSDIAAIGDILFGSVILCCAYGFAPMRTAWFFLVTLLAALLFFDFMLIVQSLAFWLGDIDDAAKRVTHMLMSFMMYPQSVFNGFLKFIMMTVVPAFFMITIPVQLILEFNWLHFIILICTAIGGTFVAFWFFGKGLARYESGNAMISRL